jgi:hypothetical protein
MLSKWHTKLSLHRAFYQLGYLAWKLFLDHYEAKKWEKCCMGLIELEFQKLGNWNS